MPWIEAEPFGIWISHSRLIKERKQRSKKLKIIRREFLAENPYCHYCSKKINKNNSTLDHVVPYSIDKNDDKSNLVLACRNCNQEKGMMSYDEFLQNRNSA